MSNPLIYESPDGGHTIYAREQGQVERVMISQDEYAKQVTKNKIEKISSRQQELEEAQLWYKIRQSAKINPALQKALDRSILIYKLISDNSK